MKPWEIWTTDIHGDHPCVILSHSKRVEMKPEVVVLLCTSMKPGNERLAEAHETILNSADGLDRKTVCRCDLLFTVPKAKLHQKRGQVCPERRRDIARKIIQGLAFVGL